MLLPAPATPIATPKRPPVASCVIISVLRLPLRGRGIDRRMALKEGVGRTLDLSGRQRGREIRRCRFGEADELTLLVGMQRGRDIPALLTAHGDALGPEKRHALAVLDDATLAKGFVDGVDVVVRPLADAGDDEGARRDLAQLLAIEHGTPSELLASSIGRAAR